MPLVLTVAGLYDRRQRFASFYIQLCRLPRRLRRALRKWRVSVAALALFLALNLTEVALADQTIKVTDDSEFQGAVTSSNQSPTNPTTISIQNSFASTSRSDFHGIVTIEGNGHTVTAGGAAFRWNINNVATVNGVTIDGGGMTDSTIMVDPGKTLTVTNSAISNGAGSYGGGIFNNGGHVTITGSTLSGNSVLHQGGAIYNTGDSVKGGNAGTVTISNSTLSGNTAAKGGAISSRAYATVLSISDSTLNGNSATNEGGAIHTNDARNVTLEGSTVSGNNARYGGGLYVDNSNVYVTGNSVISGNTVGHGGAGIRIKKGYAQILDSTVKGNSAANNGGGVHLQYGFALIEDSTISGNLSGGKGAGLYNHHGTDSCVYYACTSANYSSGYISCTCATTATKSGAKLTIKRSTISGNSSDDEGGGIHVSGSTTNLIRNSTISGNTSHEEGGGVHGSRGGAGYGHLNIYQTTITGNSARQGGGGVYLERTNLRMEQSILSGNLSSGHEDRRNAHWNTTGVNIKINQYNVMGDDQESNTGVTGKTPGSPTVQTDDNITEILDTALADNGGPTLTHAIVTSSPAQNLVPGNTCSRKYDQRDYTRNGVCDAGSFQSGSTGAAPEATATPSTGIARGVDKGPGKGRLRLRQSLSLDRHIALADLKLEFEHVLAERDREILVIDGFDDVLLEPVVDTGSYARFRTAWGIEPRVFVHVHRHRDELRMTVTARRGELRTTHFCEDGRTTLSTQIRVHGPDGILGRVESGGTWDCSNPKRLRLIHRPRPGH